MKKEADTFVPEIVSLEFRSCRPDWHLPSHFAGNNEITYLIQGKACYTIDGKPHELEAGDLLYLSGRSTKKAAANPENPMHCFSVTFEPLYPFLKAKAPAFPLVSHIGPRKDLIDMFRELTLSWDGQQTGYIMKTRALFMLILNRLSEILFYNIDSQTGDHRINKATNIITMNYPDKLTVKNLAKQVHLNTAYFGRLFKQQKGMSVNDYIRQVRVRNAETMLQSGNYKVHEVAGYCGFSDVVHFYNSFRTLRGFSPSRCIPKQSN